MKILLDTHCWLWALGDAERFSPEGRDRLRAAQNELFLSVVSAWEISIKYSLRKLTLPAEPAACFPAMLTDSRTSPLPIELRHALQVARLPFHHRDPFDRLLIAQAQVEGLPIMTADRRFAEYDLEVLGA